MIALFIAAMGFAQGKLPYKTAFPSAKPYVKTFTSQKSNATATASAVRATRDHVNIFEEGFEFSGTDLENGWTSYDQDGDSYNWQVWTNKVHTGSGAMASASYDNEAGALTPNNWLISPAIDLTSQTGTIKAAYWVAGQDNSWPREHYKVCVSTSADVASFSTILYEETIPSSGWFERTVDLSTYAGQTIYIAFVHYNITDMYMLLLDDFSVYVDQSTDAAVTEITAPTHGDYSTCALTNAEQIKINIINNGGAAISNFEVSYTINGGAAVTETVTASVAPAQTYEYTFTQTADLSAVGTYEIAASINLTGDEVEANNNASMTISNGDATIRIHAQTDAYNSNLDGSRTTWTVTNTLTDQVVAERTEESSWQWYIEVNDYVCVDASACYTVQVLDSDGMSLQASDEVHAQPYLEILYNGTQVAGSTTALFNGPSLLAERLGNGCSTDPEIATDDTEFEFVAILGSPSNTKNATIRAFNLTEGITATTAAPFEVSADNTTFAATATLAANGGTLYIRYNPTEAGEQTGSVVLSSTGAEDVTITLAGTAYDCSASISAPWTENFDETSSTIYCWSIIDNNSDGNSYGLMSDNSDNFFMATTGGEDGNDDYLITPVLTIGENNIISFDVAHYVQDYGFFQLPIPATYEVYAIVGEEEPVLIREAAETNTVFSEFETIYVDLSAFAGQNIRIAIRDITEEPYYFFVDEFSLFEITGNEIELTSISIEDESTIPAGNILISGIVSNNGVNLTSYTVSYKVDEEDAVEYNVSEINVAYASTHEFTHPTPIALEAGEHTIVVTVSNPNGETDDDINNSITVHVTAINCETISVPYSQDFENDHIACWGTISNNTANASGTNGFGLFNLQENNVFRFSSYTTAENSDYNQYLITPEIALTEDAILSFKYAKSSDNSDETFRVMASNTDNNIASFTAISDTITASSTDFTTFITTIPANTKYVAINYLSNYKYFLYIDDLSLSAVPTNSEIALTSVTPANGSSIPGGEDITISGVVTNNGIALTSYKIAYTVDDGEAVEYTVSDINVALGGTHNFTHTTPISGLAIGDHTIVVTVSEPNGVADGDASDNSMTINITVNAPLAYGCYFETDPAEEGWSFVDSDNDGNNWTWENSASTPHMTTYEGIGCIYSASYASGALTPDNWAISPAIEIENGPISVSLYAKGQDPSYPAEHFQIYAGTSADVTAMTAVSEEFVATGEYTQYTANLPESYVGQTIYVAIRHFNVSDEFVLVVDNFEVLAYGHVVITDVEENIAETIEVYPNPTSDMVTIANAEGKDIVVINSLGQVVASIENAAANQTIDVSNFANGTYFVKVDAEVVKLNVVK